VFPRFHQCRFCADSAAGLWVSQPFDSSPNVVRAQVGLALHHDLRLPSARPLDRLEIHPGHSQPRRERLPPSAFMAAGSLAERERFQPKNGPQPLLRAGCKGIYAIERRQRPTPGVGATSGGILLAEPMPVPASLTMRVSGG